MTASIAALVFILMAGVILLISRPPRGTPVVLLPPPTHQPLMVDVAGAIASPGVYRLPVGSRVQDAVEAAGGLSVNADREALNLAAPLTDGMRLSIPSISTPAPTPEPGARSSDLIIPELTPTTGLVNINTASQAELETLPRIGPATAQKIIEFRQKNGLFQTIEDLLEVSGIGPATLEEIRSLITVSP